MSSEALERIRKLAESGRLHTWDIRPASDGHMSAVETDVSPDVLTLLAALAVAREREQRAVEALERIAKMQDPPIFLGIWEAIGVARAALVDEPAAATLAEPEGATESQQATSLGGLGAADTRGAKPSGSVSAAADERICGNCYGVGVLPGRDGWGFVKPCPRCGGTGAAADEPGGVEGTVPAQWYLDLKRENQRLRAAADEPGETP